LNGELALPTRSPRRKSKRDPSKIRTVRPRTVQYDLKTLMAVLNWATVVRDGRGTVLLERNPLKGLPLPVEANPRRAVFTDEQFDALLNTAPTIHSLFGLVVIAAYHTGHRIGAVRHLRWSDVDFETNRITWRTAHDKSRLEHITPLTMELRTVLQVERRNRFAIGDGWIFPNPKDPETPLPKHVAGDWMTRGLKSIGIKEGERYGYHSIRRQFATSMKTIPLADLCALGGWKDSQTVIRCYMQPDERTMREALENRRPIRAAAN
jgi:integrase